jgi:hypothetical protein
LALAVVVCVLLCALFEIPNRRRWAVIAAVIAAAIGLAITVSIGGAAAWLTDAAHGRITLDAEPGLYLLALALLALLIAPGTRRHTQ